MTAIFTPSLHKLVRFLQIIRPFKIACKFCRNILILPRFILCQKMHTFNNHTTLDMINDSFIGLSLMGSTPLGGEVTRRERPANDRREAAE
ncbi:hypothetical protein J2S10_005405 [Neobacillus ginsengisoli]|uniref:Uncharacterized protein n=1 Tax=Neobacillus ginsengisoli TaxID=904295 RepID=A0ABT9Y2Y5_9BACI|nr:hypothetical protein [Neobacillus ginsengisoli]